MKNLFSNKQIDRVVTSAALDKTESIKFKRMLLSLGSGLVDNQYKQSFVVGSYINSLGEKKKNGFWMRLIPHTGRANEDWNGLKRLDCWWDILT